MLVLDYPRKVKSVLDAWSIVVPPFHTGHLGLVPESIAHVSLMRSADQSPAPGVGELSFCELLITPFERRVGELVRVECTMVDRPGVVEALIEAVSSLGVNIVTEESTITELPAQHQVNMIIDLTPAAAGVRESDGAPPPEFQEYVRNVSLSDAPLARIFEAIAAYCGPYLTWDKDGNGERPRVRIRRVHERRGVELDVRVPVVGGDSGRYNVRLNPPQELARRIRARLGINSADMLSYFLVSETEERALHAYVYRNDVRTGLFHLGFYHYDTPGALSAILKLVARARFNIVTSLLRNQSERAGVWEAVLEYRGNRELPAVGASPQDRVIWAGDRLREQADPNDVVALQNVEAHVGPPHYPKLEDPLRSLRLPLWPVGPVGAAPAGHTDQPLPPGVGIDDRWAPARRRLAEAVARHRSPVPPTVFLSFPESASEHASALGAALRAEGYRTDHAMSSEGQVILDDIFAKIAVSEYFIGIWHYTDHTSTGDTFSPWLPFEYGVALARKKPALVVRHERLPPHVWNRIESTRNKPGYTDFNFASKTIPMILDYARKHFPRR